MVEGKYDKITLENIIDAPIFTTEGFGIFKNREMCALLKKLSQRDGIIVMTDSDSAGALIRSYLKNVCAGGKIVNVYIPQLSGKERRKRVPSKQGFLGVEGMSAEIISAALKRSGITAAEETAKRMLITKQDLFQLGLSGRENSALLREKLSKYLCLPSGMSANAFLDAVNAVYEYNEFREAVKRWEREHFNG